MKNKFELILFLEFLAVLIILASSFLNIESRKSNQQEYKTNGTKTNCEVKIVYYFAENQKSNSSNEVTTSLVYENNSNIDFSCKPYMDISKITNRTSKQWQYLKSLNCVYEDKKGLLRVNNDTGYILTDDEYIGVAMGEFWGDIGTKYHIYLDTGIILKVIKVEAKANDDTCCHNFVGAEFNDIIELVIDSNTPYMQERLNFTRYDGEERTSNGLIYNGNFNNSEEFNGNIVKIKKVK